MFSAFDYHARCWSPPEASPLFPNLSIQHRTQIGGTCVSTGLSLLTEEKPEEIRKKVNTQDPVSWSRYLGGYQMKLAYCSYDFRRLRHYVDELLAHNDLFTISTYTPTKQDKIGCNPDEHGWVCASHFVVLYRDTVYDTRIDHPVALRDYRDLNRYVKRLFRVVPINHVRGL